MQLIPHAERITTPRALLRYQRIDGMPPRGQNVPKIDEDPSGLSRLNLVGRDYPVGNGAGPEIEKLSAQRWGAPLKRLTIKLAVATPMSPGLAAVHDPVKSEAAGKLISRDPWKRPDGMPEWQTMTPNLPFLNTSLFDLARGLRNRIQTTRLPAFVQQSAPLRTALGAGTGAAIAAGAGWLANLFNQERTPLSNYILPGAAIAGYLGYGRGSHQ